MIIEFVGLPGSGKSFQLQKLKSYCPEVICVSTQDYYSLQQSFSRMYILCRFLFYIVNNLKLLLLLRRYKYPAQTFRSDMLLLFFLSNYKAFLKKYRNEDVVVIDQGLVQRLWYPFYRDSITMTADHEHITKEIIKLLYKKIPYCVVLFNIAPEVAASRAVNRGGDCFADRTDYTLLLNIYSEAIKGLECIKKVAEKVVDYNENDNISAILKKALN